MEADEKRAEAHGHLQKGKMQIARIAEAWPRVFYGFSKVKTQNIGTYFAKRPPEAEMVEQSNGVAELQAAIELRHLCKSVHRKTVFVHERMKTHETVWSGYVQVFDLIGHPEAQTCYAWRHSEPEGVKILTLLGNHVVTSPQRAVQAAIFVGVQPPASKFSNDIRMLNRRLRKTRKVLHDAKIKIEDLDALIQAAAQLKEDIREKRLAA
jgi:hypothetical protein